MGALPSPVLPPGAHQDLVRALHELHHEAGWPSLRSLARRTGVSHTTVSKVFSSSALPAWGTVELLVEAMGGGRAEFHALWLAASSANDDAPAPTLRIAGRRAELAVVRDHLAGHGGLLVVAGEAGIGKSTLVDAAAALADTRVVVGRCLPFSTEVPLMPVVELLRSIHDADDGRWIGEALSDCPAYAREALARLLPELSAAAASTDDVDFAQQHLYAAVAAVLAGLAATRPLAVVVEDLHVSDATTLDLLEYVLSRDVAVPLTVTWRLDDQTVHRWRGEWLARVQALPGVRTLALGPLTLEETRDQLRLAGWLDGSSPDRARQIHERSRGHPLFTAHLAIQGDDPTLPPLLADLLDRRLGDLSPDQDRVATALGVADGPVGVELVAAATGLDDDDVLDALRHLAGRHLVSVGATDTVRLAHPLLADAARRRLLPAEVRRLHHAFAELLGRGGDADPAVVAEHWRLSGETTEEAWWRAAAARQARRRTDPRSEAEHWLRILELGRQHVVAPEGLLTAWLSAFDALQLSGRLEACAALVEEEQPDVDALPDEQAARVIRRAAQVAWLVGDDPEAAVVLADRALDRLAGHPVGSALVHVLDQRANALMDLARYDEATHDLQGALDACAELDDDALYFQTAATLGWHVGHLGDLTGALDLFRRARSRVAGTAGPWREADLAMMHTDVLLQHHRPPHEVEEAARLVLDLGREWQLDFHLLTLVKANVVEAYLDAGRTGEAAARLVDVPRSHSYDDWPGQWVSARLDIVQGRTDDAIRTMRGLVKVGSSTRNRLNRAVWEATALLWQEEPEQAWAALRDPLEAFLDSAGIADYWMAFLVLARAAADTRTPSGGRPSEEDTTALEDLEDMRRRARLDPLGAQRSSAGVAAGLAWEAELARARGTDTVDQWSRAAVAWGHLGRPHAAAYCRWRAAQVALREGRGAVADRLLRRAAADAREHVPLSRVIAESSDRPTEPRGSTTKD